MKTFLRVALPLIATIAISACSTSGASGVPASTAGAGHTVAFEPLAGAAPQWLVEHLARPDCPQVIGKPTCLALRVLKNGAVPDKCKPATSCGFTALGLQTAYKLTDKLGKGTGVQIALIEVGDYPNAADDIGVYRTQYKLSPANLIRYNQHGKTTDFPESCADFAWCVETALDFDMVSASCPNCTIDLIEADSTIRGFEQAEASAVKLGAKIISNSWLCYGSWNCGHKNFETFFTTNGVAYLGSSGDYGYNQIGGPSVLPNVLAVGGTQLKKSGTVFSETAWDDAGSGCASASVVGADVPKPAWQTDPDCTTRTDSDVSAQAGCKPGVAMYSGFYGGWISECGTSVAAPFLAGVVALAGNASQLKGGQWVWSLNATQKKNRLNVITSGSNGSCDGSYLCTAGTNQFDTYSGPTGWGTPKKPRAL
jgi:subtilase family serine protease